MEKLRSIKKFFVRLAILFVVLFLASLFRIVQFHYPRAVENDPLLAPVKVESVQGETIVLEDGRSLRVDYFGSEPLEEVIEGSDFKVDIETERVDERSMTTIYVKHRSWICGTPWVAFINIPLIPDDIPINRRKRIGWAKVDAEDGDIPRAQKPIDTKNDLLIVDEQGVRIPGVGVDPVVQLTDFDTRPSGVAKGMTRVQALVTLKAEGLEPWEDTSVADQYERFRKRWMGGYHFVALRMSDEGYVAEVSNFWNDP